MGKEAREHLLEFRSYKLDLPWKLPTSAHSLVHPRAFSFFFYLWAELCFSWVPRHLTNLLPRFLWDLTFSVGTGTGGYLTLTVHWPNLTGASFFQRKCTEVPFLCLLPLPLEGGLHLLIFGLVIWLKGDGEALWCQVVLVVWQDSV